MPKNGNGNALFATKFTSLPFIKCTAAGTSVNIGLPFISTFAYPKKDVLFPCNIIDGCGYSRVAPVTFVNLSTTIC